MQTIALSSDKTTIKYISEILLGTFLIALFAQIRIPLSPVAITLQTVAIMLIGYRLAPMQALSSVILYIALGYMGVPVFTNYTYGLGVLLGPNAGYIVGFIPAVVFLSYFRQKCSKHWLALVGLGVAANAVVYLFGIGWLAHLTGLNKAVTYGLLPFIIPGIAKVLILVSLLKLSKSF